MLERKQCAGGIIENIDLQHDLQVITVELTIMEGMCSVLSYKLYIVSNTKVDFEPN
jgi:hypothetical protein